MSNALPALLEQVAWHSAETNRLEDAPSNGVLCALSWGTNYSLTASECDVVRERVAQLNAAFWAVL